MTPLLVQKLPTQWTIPEPESDWHNEPELKESLQACEVITKEHATSFYFSSFPLPREKRWASFAVYAFCRWVDDTIDEEPDPAQVEPATLLDTLDNLFSGKSELPFARAFNAVNRQYDIPKAFYADLIKGCCMDRRPMKIQTYEELEVYCYYVASVVGLMMSKIFGLKDLKGVHQAVEMGIAMQLTNILRDIHEDYQKGRVYVPLEELALFSLDENSIKEKQHADPNWEKFMRFQIERARSHYENASPGLALLSNDGSRLTAKLMARVYGGILEEIEKNHYDIFSKRVYVPTWRKIILALRAIAS